MRSKPLVRSKTRPPEGKVNSWQRSGVGLCGGKDQQPGSFSSSLYLFPLQTSSPARTEGPSAVLAPDLPKISGRWGGRGANSVFAKLLLHVGSRSYLFPAVAALRNAAGQP